MRHLLKRPSPAMGVALIALFIALGGTTYAATGGNFILGNPNSATSQTALSAPIAGKALQVTNTSTGTGATALGLNVAAGKTPFTVNSSTKVGNLNADKLDALDSSAFLRTTGKAADSNLLDGIDSTGFYEAGSKVADSDLLDGMDSTAFTHSVMAESTTSGTIPPTAPFTLSGMGSATFTTATAGKIFVFSRASFGSPCGIGPNCFIRVGVYVDDQPVVGSGAIVTPRSGSTATWTFTSFGVADSIPAGEHTLHIVARYVAGSYPGGWSTSNSMIGGIGLG